MPLYEYQCEDCNRTFEVIQRFSDDPVAVCKFCGGPVHRLLSAPAIQFKGTGWYITDYARKGQSDGATVAASHSNNGNGDKSSSDASTSTTPASSGSTDSASTAAKKD
jgi:putative FmdB family regulatory protein